jgi:hypothetical protein
VERCEVRYERAFSRARRRRLRQVSVSNGGALIRRDFLNFNNRIKSISIKKNANSLCLCVDLQIFDLLGTKHHQKKKKKSHNNKQTFKPCRRRLANFAFSIAVCLPPM